MMKIYQNRPLLLIYCFLELFLDLEQRSWKGTTNPTQFIKCVIQHIYHLKYLSLHIQERLTIKVRTTPVVSTPYPYRGSCSLILTSILIQKVKAGHPIKNEDKYRDPASGPSTNLPAQRNFCHTTSRSLSTLILTQAVRSLHSKMYSHVALNYLSNVRGDSSVLIML